MSDSEIRIKLANLREAIAGYQRQIAALQSRIDQIERQCKHKNLASYPTLEFDWCQDCGQHVLRKAVK